MFDYNIQERVDLFVEVGSVQAGGLPARAAVSYIPLQHAARHAACNEVLLAGC